MAWARFDDLLTGRARSFSAPSAVHLAVEADEVAGVLAAVDAATSAGAWAYGYLAYEAAPGLDPNLQVWPPQDSALPLAWFAVCDSMQQVPVVDPPLPGQYQVEGWQPQWQAAEYGAQVEAIRSAIAAGLSYQGNLTTGLQSGFTGSTEAFYADLVYRQRGSYAAYLDIGSHVIASASPELFFDLSGIRLSTRPMKGTGARGRTSAEDHERRQALLGSEKERAENVMIVDLLRNDLGKIARAGTVAVSGLFTPERYETVWQLTSEVSAQVDAGSSLLEVFRALFPSGSITGAPKQSTMHLLAELERAPRGVYCGAIGYVAPGSSLHRARFSVAIRTAVLARESGIMSYGTGGGITWSSEPAREEAELLEKAAILSEPYQDFELLETMRYEPIGGLVNLSGHLRRLADSAEYFGFGFDAAAVAAALAEGVSGSGSARVRLLLERSGRVTVQCHPLPPAATTSVGLVVDGEAIDSQQPWFFHKTTRRSAYTQRAERHREADDVVLVNEYGFATETTIANLAAWVDGRWVTPPVSDGCLPGVERGRLVSAGELQEAHLTLSDLRRADGLALISSLRGWRSAHLLEKP